MTPRVLVVTADMGAGHREVARELARRLSAEGAQCRVVDVVAEAGPAGRRLRSTYRGLLRHAPWVYGSAMRFWGRWPAPLETFTAATSGPFTRLLAASVDAFCPDVVVSTWNLAGQALGRRRRSGALRAPVVTLVVDPGPHPYWVSRDVDLHLALTPRTAAALARLGAPRVGLAGPVLRPEFAAPPPRAAARHALGLPPDRRVVLVNAGSWAAGDPERTVRAVRAGSDALVVALCGRDERTLRGLSDVAGVRPVGWTAEVAEHLAAADLVVDNAGGLTCWEALACGTPVVLHDPLPGHGRLNAATLDAAGLAPWARTRRMLAEWVATPPPAPVLPATAATAQAQVLAAAGARA